MNNPLDVILKEIHAIKSRGKYSNQTVGLEVKHLVYGESNFDAIDAIVEKFKDYFNSTTIFYDLGSGTGKIPIHIGLKYKVFKSVGIEYSKERCLFIDDIKIDYPDLDYSNISILNESFFDSDISDATVIYIDNTMYNDPIYESKMYSKIPDGCFVISRKDIFDRCESDIKDEYLTSYGKKSIYYHTKDGEISRPSIDKKLKILDKIKSRIQKKES